MTIQKITNHKWLLVVIIATGILLSFIFLYLPHSSQEKTVIQQKNNINVALGSEPRTLDPRRATDANGMRIVDLLFQSLVYLDKDLNIKPEIAQSWTYKDQTYTFVIPKGITFSNGRKLTEEDIIFSFQEYRDKKNPFSSAFQIIHSVKTNETEDQILLKIKLKQDSAKFLNADLPVLKILPKKEILETPALFRRKWIGTGAFYLFHSDSNQIVLKARKGILKSPRIDQVTFKIIRDSLTRTYKMLNGELDIAQSEIPFSKIDSFLEKKEKFHIISNTGNATTYLLINFKDSCLADRNLRLAIALSLDRQKIIEYKLYNKARLAKTILNPLDFYFNKELGGFLPDIEKAVLLLDKVSSNCRTNPLALITSQSRSAVEHGKILALQMRKAGLSVNLRSFEWGTFYGDLNAGRFQLALLKWTGIVDPDIYRLAFHSAEKPPKGRNRGSYSNAKLDSLLETGSVTMDKIERQSMYNKVQKMIQEDVAFLPLWHEDQITIASSSILNYYLSRNGDFRYLFQIEKN